MERLQDIYLRGVSIATSNAYLGAVKGFSRWLLEKERIDRDRLVSLSKLNADTDPRHTRRALDEAELNRLVASAWDSSVIFEGLNGIDRAMIYTLSMSTGLRASEQASMTPSSFSLETVRPTATVRAAYTKNRDEAEQPLPADVAEAFRDYLGGRPAGAALWPGKWNERAAEMLRIDLEAAGILYRDGEGEVADFHSLRHSYISLLGRLGVSPKVTQTLARHSDIRLTMNVYSHTRMHDLSAAVDGFPIDRPGSKRSEARELATGTDGLPAQARGIVTKRPEFSIQNEKRFQCASSESEEACQNMTNGDDSNSKEDDSEGNPQTLSMIGDGDACGTLMKHAEEAGVLGFEANTCPFH